MPRIGVRAVVLSGGRTLVQKPADEPGACYAFIGGEYEPADTFISRLRQEFEEETTAQLVGCEYLFVVETRFHAHGYLICMVDHYFEVTLDRDDVVSREAHLAQYWLPVATLKDYDLRPRTVRDVIAAGRHRCVRHLVDGPASS